MPPWRTTPEIRDASMPDSRATIASASSDVWRCCTSKSAGTYSASITGVIGSTFRSRTVPLYVWESVAAVAMAGLARSVSARSIGTRMDLNICTSPVVLSLTYLQDLAREQVARCRRIKLALARPRTFGRARHDWRTRLIVRSLLQELWADEQHQSAAAKCHLGPVLDGKVEHGKA